MTPRSSVYIPTFFTTVEQPAPAQGPRDTRQTQPAPQQLYYNAYRPADQQVEAQALQFGIRSFVSGHFPVELPLPWRQQSITELFIC